mgnify:CR=1 FL=1
MRVKLAAMILGLVVTLSSAQVVQVPAARPSGAGKPAGAVARAASASLSVLPVKAETRHSKAHAAEPRSIRVLPPQGLCDGR